MNKSIRLQIKQGFLLKSYFAPYAPANGGGHRMRQGWTPDRTPAMHARFDELKLETAGKNVADFLLWKQVEIEEGKRLAKLKRPYPGWFPIGPQSDKAISRAYRALFVAMNPGSGGVRATPRRKAIYPPDGDYIFERGVMRPVTDEHGVGAQYVTGAINEIVGEVLRSGTLTGAEKYLALFRKLEHALIIVNDSSSSSADIERAIDDALGGGNNAS